MGEDSRRQGQAGVPGKMGEMVKTQYMEARIAENDLQPRPGGGVAGTNRVDFFPKSLEIHGPHYVMVRDPRNRVLPVGYIGFPTPPVKY